MLMLILSANIQGNKIRYVCQFESSARESTNLLPVKSSWTSVVEGDPVKISTLRDFAGSRVLLNPTTLSHPRQTQTASTTSTMALLVDKHRPRSLETLTYHHDLSERLRSLVISLLPQCWPGRTDVLTGAKRRLPASSDLWTFRRGQKDKNHSYTARTLRPWCGEDKD